MKRQASSAGFTIVETMVVLAVTGALFVSIAATISGRQQKSEFTQAIQDVRAQIQQSIANVQSGYYTSKGTYNCSVAGSTLTIGSGANKLGTNESCVFLGNVMQFDKDGIIIYPIAGSRTATSLSDSYATPIVGNGVDESTTYALKYGLTPTKMVYVDGAGEQTIGAFGMLAPAGENSSGTGASNLALDVYGLDGTARDDATPVTSITNSLRNSPVMNPSGGVKICFKSGTTNDFGLITIGQDNRQLNVQLDITGIGGCGI